MRSSLIVDRNVYDNDIVFNDSDRDTDAVLMYNCRFSVSTIFTATVVFIVLTRARLLGQGQLGISQGQG